MKALRDIVLFALLWLLAGAALAHEVRPGYLELREIDDRTYDLLWKVPAKGRERLGLYVRLPEHCSSSPLRSYFTAGAYLERWRAACTGGLTGSPIKIEGLSGMRTDVLARVEWADGTVQTVRLTPVEPAFTVTASPDAWAVMKTYFVLGVEHILLGIDHLLFVLALLFLVRDRPRLIGTVTAFTVAHSITLTAATLGWIHVPQPPVEAVIALSILFVAVEVLNTGRGYPGLAARKPWVVAFLFGLLHGFGFAGALREVGLPEHAIPLALAFFNIGVEAGQLLFIAVFIVLVWTATILLSVSAGSERDRRGTTAWNTSARLASPSAYVIGTLASFWLIERTYGFWN